MQEVNLNQKEEIYDPNEPSAPNPTHQNVDHQRSRRQGAGTIQVAHQRDVHIGRAAPPKPSDLAEILEAREAKISKKHAFAQKMREYNQPSPTPQKAKKKSQSHER